MTLHTCGDDTCGERRCWTEPQPFGRISPTTSRSAYYGDAGSIDGEGPCSCPGHAGEPAALLELDDGRRLVLNRPHTDTRGKAPRQLATVAVFGSDGTLAYTYTDRPDEAAAYYEAAYTALSD